jgi:hypothetical protein
MSSKLITSIVDKKLKKKKKHKSYISIRVVEIHIEKVSFKNERDISPNYINFFDKQIT